MKFIHPAAFWLLLTLPLLAISYFLIRKKLRVSVVSHLDLWDDVFAKSFSSARNLKFRRLFSFFLAALTACLFVAAVIYPVADKRSANAVIVIIDHSASMNAEENDGLTRLEKAVNYLGLMITHKFEEQEMMIITADEHPEIILGFTKDASALRESLKKIRSTDRVSSFRNSLELADSIQKSRPGAVVRVITDGCCKKEEIPWMDLKNKTDVLWTQIGSPLENLGFTVHPAFWGSERDILKRT